MRLGRRFRVSVLASVPVAVLAAGALLVSGIASAGVHQRPAPVNDYITFYGYVDNNPPGRAITHPCIHAHAGGVGTYSNPVTSAQGSQSGPWCQIIYIPFLKKYFIHEDSECGNQCTPASRHHVDLWMGGDRNSLHNPEKQALLNCEDKWTTHSKVILKPPSNEPVDSTPLFTPPATCHGGQGD